MLKLLGPGDLRKQVCLGPKTLHYAKFWAQNATKTSAGNIPESLSNLFLRDTCRLLQRLLNNAKVSMKRPNFPTFTKLEHPRQQQFPSKIFRYRPDHGYPCDPRVPLQRSKLENRENYIFGVKKCLFGGPSWNHLNGLFGAFNSSPPY